MAKKKTDPAKLTVDEALALLSPHKEKNKLRVHSLEGFSGIMMGCDIDMTQIKKYLKTSEHICLAGPNMRGMGHGVAYHTKGKGYTFLQTDKEKLDAIHIKRKIK